MGGLLQRVPDEFHEDMSVEAGQVKGVRIHSTLSKLLRAEMI